MIQNGPATPRLAPRVNAGELGLFDSIVASRLAMFIAFIVVAPIAYFAAGRMTRAYKAEALILPVESSAVGLAGGLSSLVGASALAGLGLSPSVNKNEAIETLRSHALLRQFIEERHLLPLLCRSEAIDCRTQRGDSSLILEREENDAVKLFRDDLLSVSEDTLSGVIHVSVTWYDRTLAADWCNGIIAMTNRRMQDKARDVAARRVQFLRHEYDRAEIVSLRASISTMMQSELGREMDAGTRPDYALRILDPAGVPDDRRPVRPRRAVIGAVSGVVAALLILGWTSLRRRRLH